GVLSLSFASLLAAAYFFGPGRAPEALATIALAYLVVFFAIYWWFLEENRKRRVMFLEEAPREHDSTNPDLRDEVIFCCGMLFLITPLLLQTMNEGYLHYSVASDEFGLRKLICGSDATASFCIEHKRLVEFPSWTLFTLMAFAKTVPIGEQ